MHQPVRFFSIRHLLERVALYLPKEVRQTRTVSQLRRNVERTVDTIDAPGAYCSQAGPAGSIRSTVPEFSCIRASCRVTT